jgi:type VI secretion system protein VasG
VIRSVIIPFFPVRDQALLEIVRLKVSKIRRRLYEAHRIDFVLEDAVIEEIGNRCTEVESGARNIDNILTNTMLPAVSRLLLRSLVEENPPRAIRIGVGDDGEFTYAAEALERAAERAAEPVPVGS